VVLLRRDPPLAALLALDWIARIEETSDARLAEPRLVLLADESTPLAPLVQLLLLERRPHVEALWTGARFDQLVLADLLDATSGGAEAPDAGASQAQAPGSGSDLNKNSL